MTIAPPTNWRTRSRGWCGTAGTSSWWSGCLRPPTRWLEHRRATYGRSSSPSRPTRRLPGRPATVRRCSTRWPAGDRTERCWRRSSMLLRCRPATKRVSEPRCRYASAARSTPGGADPVRVDAEVVRVGDGDYPLTGVGYTGITVSMGRFAVVRRGSMQLLLTELPAWSADPGTWRHAGLDPYDDRRPGRSVVHRLHRELPGLGRDRGGRRRARSCDASTDAADVRALRRRAVPSRSDGHALTAAGNGYDTNAAFCFVADG